MSDCLVFESWQIGWAELTDDKQGASNAFWPPTKRKRRTRDRRCNFTVPAAQGQVGETRAYLAEVRDSATASPKLFSRVLTPDSHWRWLRVARKRPDSGNSETVALGRKYRGNGQHLVVTIQHHDRLCVGLRN